MSQRNRQGDAAPVKRAAVDCRVFEGITADFVRLTEDLDRELWVKNGDSQGAYHALNTLDGIRDGVVAYLDGEAVGCASFKLLSPGVAEVKRVFVSPAARGWGVSKALMHALESLAVSRGVATLVLETSRSFAEAVGLYLGLGYTVIPNYPPYTEMAASVCFQKNLPLPGDQNMKANLMTHMIAGYPDFDTSLETARALVAGGASMLEIQFPFSDPSADGPAIQAACTEALAAGFKVDDGWRLVETVRREFPGTPVFVMSYASIVVTKGVEAFCARAQRAGVTGLIIPDLAPGADEGLYDAGHSMGLAIVPVIVPSVPRERLESVLVSGPEWVYTAIRAGITGTHTTLTAELRAFLSSLNARAKVMAGFGIDSTEQIRDLQGSAHTIVVGSVLVRAVAAAMQAGGRGAVRTALEAKVRELAG